MEDHTGFNALETVWPNSPDMSRAVCVTREINSSRRPPVLYFGQEILTAATTLPEISKTGAATQKRPISISSSSMEYP